MRDWLEHLIRHPLIPQFFAREHATIQVAHDWGQAAWERNERAVRGGAKTFLVREFATPGWDSLTLETLGLAEVTYPGIEVAQPRPQFLAGFSSDIADRIRSDWATFLASICDTIRNDTAITLGSDEQDFEAFHYPLGKWVSLSDRAGANLVPFSDRGKASPRRAGTRSEWACSKAGGARRKSLNQPTVNCSARPTMAFWVRLRRQHGGMGPNSRAAKPGRRRRRTASA